MQNLPLQVQLGSPPPTLPCSHCPRRFRSKGGRTKHIKVKHPPGANAGGPNLNPQASNLTPPPSPAPSSLHSSSHNIRFEQPPSPIPSGSTPIPPPSRGEADADIGVDAEYPQPEFDRDCTPPASELNMGDDSEWNDDLPPTGRDDPMQVDAPNAPHIIYHPKLNGEFLFLPIHQR